MSDGSRSRPQRSPAIASLTDRVSSMGIAQLPIELLVRIFWTEIDRDDTKALELHSTGIIKLEDEVREREHRALLSRAVRVCRRWHQALTPELYRRVFIDIEDSSESLSTTLMANVDRGKHVTVLVFTHGGDGECNPHSVGVAISDILDACQQLVAITDAVCSPQPSTLDDDMSDYHRLVAGRWQLPVSVQSYSGSTVTAYEWHAAAALRGMQLSHLPPRPRYFKAAHFTSLDSLDLDFNWPVGGLDIQLPASLRRLRIRAYCEHRFDRRIELNGPLRQLELDVIPDADLWSTLADVEGLRDLEQLVLRLDQRVYEEDFVSDSPTALDDFLQSHARCLSRLTVYRRSDPTLSNVDRLLLICEKHGVTLVQLIEDTVRLDSNDRSIHSLSLLTTDCTLYTCSNYTCTNCLINLLVSSAKPIEL